MYLAIDFETDIEQILLYGPISKFYLFCIIVFEFIFIVIERIIKCNYPNTRYIERKDYSYVHRNKFCFSILLDKDTNYVLLGRCLLYYCGTVIYD